jgi:hypothetical protein
MASTLTRGCRAKVKRKELAIICLHAPLLDAEATPLCALLEEHSAQAVLWIEGARQCTDVATASGLVNAERSLAVDLCEEYVRACVHCLLLPQCGDNEPRSKEAHCLCREGDDGSAMVCCDSCEQWFHTRCVGIRRKKDLDALDAYVCMRCAQKRGQRYVFAWDRPGTDPECSVGTRCSGDSHKSQLQKADEHEPVPMD